VKDLQVLANVRLAGIEPLNELPDVQLPLCQQDPQDRETGAVTEDTEALGDVFEEVDREVVCHGSIIL
jgi:hypothetical protein